eukprot:gene27941-biopygen3368
MWLSNWEGVNLRGQQPHAPPGNRKNPKDLFKKAVLLSGPPGIGKTSAAHILANECNFEIVEMNASDTRNKSDSKISAGMGGKSANMIKEMATNRSLLVGADGKMKKQLLIMDEVDGMSGGDRGGVQDLIQTIKSSKVPIICICNDKWNQKLKSLRNYCVELDFRSPTPQQVKIRMMEICRKEGLTVNDATMEALAKGANADLRTILGQLQMVRLSRTTLSYDDVKGSQACDKDIDLSPFECARKLLEPASSSMSIQDRLNLAMVDDIVPLLIQENYLNHRPVIAETEEHRMRAVAKSAEAISAGDVINTSVRRYMNWSLMPAFNTLACLVPGAYMRGGRDAFWPGDNYSRFTSWLGNFSTSNKQKRLLGELTTTMASSRSPVRLEYLSAMRTLLTRPLVTDGESGGIQQSVTLMQDYCVSREMFDYVIDVTKFKTKADWGEDPMKDVPTKIKSAFTRSFNRQGLQAKCGAMLSAPLKGKKGKKGAAGAEDGADDDEDESGVEKLSAGVADEDDDADDGDEMVAAAKAQLLSAKLIKRGMTMELNNCRCTYAPPFQDGDSEVALTLPGKVMHVRALCSGLASIRPSLLYVKHALQDHHHDMDWTIFQDTVARELTMASMFLGGILDGCVIAEMQQSIDKGGPAAPKRSVSFKGTMFQDATLRNIQEGVNGLRSFYFEEQSVQASLWTVINCWKHYFPYQPLPTEFSRGRLDFQLVLDSNHAALDTGIPESKDSLNSKPLSGPVVHDLLIPAFNAACGITARLVEIYAVSGNHTIDQIKNM